MLEVLCNWKKLTRHSSEIWFKSWCLKHASPTKSPSKLCRIGVVLTYDSGIYIGLICLVLRETDVPELKEGLLSLGSEVEECFVFPLLIFWLTNCSEYFSSFFHRGGTEAESKTRWVKGWCSLHFRDESQARVVFEKKMERKAAAGDADVNIDVDADAQKTSSPRRHRFDFLTDSSKLFAPKAVAKHQHIIFSD